MNKVVGRAGDVSVARPHLVLLEAGMIVRVTVSGDVKPWVLKASSPSNLVWLYEWGGDICEAHNKYKHTLFHWFLLTNRFAISC